MSRARTVLSDLPPDVAKIIGSLGEPLCPEETLWRKVATRAVLDAMGHTGLSEHAHHNRVVRSARLWLRFGHNDPDVRYRRHLSPAEVFDLGCVDFLPARRCALARPALYREEKRHE